MNAVDRVARGLALFFALQMFCSVGLAQPMPLPRPEVADSRPASSWQYDSFRDRFDDADTHLLWTDDLNASHAAMRREARTVRASLLVHCSGDRFWLTVHAPGVLLATSRGFVSYRVDDRPPVRRMAWRANVSSDGVGLIGWSQARRFVDALRNGHRLSLRVEHDVFGSLEADFVIDDFSKAFERLAAVCRIPAQERTRER